MSIQPDAGTHARRGSVLAAVVVGLALMAVATCDRAAGAAQMAHRAHPVIVFLSDFGTLDDAVAICKGVMLSLAPGAQIVDLTHQVMPYSIAEGARLLTRTAQYFPAGTIFVTVIDPGVGTSRRSVVVKTRRQQYFVLPDNGLVTQILERDGLEGAREIRNTRWLLDGSNSSTFHGRDVFSPVAAHLARGDDWRLVGPLVTDLARFEPPRAAFDERGIHGSVVALDGPYGNLVTNIDRDAIRALGYSLGELVHLRLGEVELTLPFVATFGDVPAGQSLVFIDSRGLVSLAVNQGNFAQRHDVAPPIPLFVYRR